MSAATEAEARTAVVFRRACAAEWLRIRTVRATWWCLLAAAVIIVGFGVILGIDLATNPEPGHPRPHAAQAGEASLLAGQFALLVLVVLTVTSEYATGAITTTLQWTPRRAVLLASRTLVAVAVATTSGVVLALAAGLAASAAAPALALTASGLATSLGTVAFVVAAGSALALGAGLATRSTAGGLAVVVLAMFVLPVFLPAFGLTVLDALAGRLPGGAVAHLLTGEPEMTDAEAVAVLLGWAGAALAAGGLSLLRRDASR